MPENMEQIVEQLIKISEHLGEISNPGLHEGLLLAVIGAFSAFMFNILHWRIVQRHSKISKAADSLVNVISELEPIAVRYWLEDACDIDNIEREFQEIKIKTLNRLIIKSTENFKQALNKSNKEHKIKLLASFQDNIFELSTGDDFETLRRLKDYRTASRIASECTDFRLFLEKHRP